jgi:hypothetical protein
MIVYQTIWLSSGLASLGIKPTCTSSSALPSRILAFSACPRPNNAALACCRADRTHCRTVLLHPSKPVDMVLLLCPIDTDVVATKLGDDVRRRRTAESSKWRKAPSLGVIVGQPCNCRVPARIPARCPANEMFGMTTCKTISLLIAMK